MQENIKYLEQTSDAFMDIANKVSDISEIIEKGDEQADVRKGAIQTINEMCDSLRLACDLISRELSSSVVEFHQVRTKNEPALRGYFERVAIKLTEPSIRILLHEGKVCGELHALYDRFSQPFSNATTGGVSFWENVKTFFTRSNSMSVALNGLREGEAEYLRNFSSFLDEIRNKAESALSRPWGDLESLRQDGEEIASLMRQKRETLQNQLITVRDAADTCIGKLH